jgi:2-dehydro-3-deoxyphosphogluconate aldolase/(4S)-4-hydroxy-2-oxoglutarate aldolase
MESPLLQSLRAARVVPVVRTHEARHASTVVQWLRDAGVRIFEITMQRSPRRATPRMPC